MDLSIEDNQDSSALDIDNEEHNGLIYAGASKGGDGLLNSLQQGGAGRGVHGGSERPGRGKDGRPRCLDAVGEAAWFWEFPPLPARGGRGRV